MNVNDNKKIYKAISKYIDNNDIDRLSEILSSNLSIINDIAFPDEHFDYLEDADGNGIEVFFKDEQALKTSSKCGLPLVFLPVLFNNIEALNEFIKHNADLTVTDCKGLTLLHLSCAIEDVCILKLLIDRNLFINKTDVYGTTPLMTAAIFGNLKAIKILNSYEGEIDPESSYLYNPLYFSILCDYHDCFLYILSKTLNINKKNINSETILLQVIDKNIKSKYIFHLIENGADVNLFDKHRVSPLIMAIIDNVDISIIKELIDYGADIEHTDNNGFDALLYSVKDGNYEKAELLLSLGAYPNKVYCEEVGIYLLGIAIENQDFDMVYLLLYFNADIRNGYKGMSAIMFASLLMSSDNDKSIQIYYLIESHLFDKEAENKTLSMINRNLDKKVERYKKQIKETENKKEDRLCKLKTHRIINHFKRTIF